MEKEPIIDERTYTLFGTYTEQMRRTDEFSTWKANLEKMRTPELEALVMGNELFQDVERTHEKHQLAPKDPKCEKCNSNRGEHFRCVFHQRKCVCGRQYTNLDTWHGHKRKWALRPEYFQKNEHFLLDPETTIRKLSQLEQSCFEFNNILRQNGNFWKKMFWKSLSSQPIEHIRKALCLSFLNPHHRVKYWHRELIQGSKMEKNPNLGSTTTTTQTLQSPTSPAITISTSSTSRETVATSSLTTSPTKISKPSSPLPPPTSTNSTTSNSSSKDSNLTGQEFEKPNELSPEATSTNPNVTSNQSKKLNFPQFPDELAMTDSKEEKRQGRRSRDEDDHQTDQRKKLKGDHCKPLEPNLESTKEGHSPGSFLTCSDEEIDVLGGSEEHEIMAISTPKTELSFKKI